MAINSGTKFAITTASDAITQQTFPLCTGIVPE